MEDPVWSELGRIDYFLDQLARAVERGEVPAESYDRLAPRYLERRAELAGILASRSQRAAAGAERISAVPRAAVATRRPPADFYDEDGMPVVPPPVQRQILGPPRVRPPRPAAPPREPVAVSTLLAYVGALLVIVAAAIFTVYNWESFSPQVKLAALAAVTLVFYAGGESVRVGLKLPVIGVALLGVGSAMLLFDGWMVITALDLTGPMPWAFVLLACSVVYWLTEVRVAGHWFGAIGAAAQVVWWWLLGRGLGWSAMPTLAVLAAVALAWTLVGRRTPREGPLETLGVTLRAGGPALAVVTAAASLPAVTAGVIARTWGYPELAEAVAVAVLAAAAIELTPRVRAVSACALLPVLPAVGALRFLSSPTWGVDVAVLVAFALACAVYAAWRGGPAFALASVVASVAAPFVGPPGGAPETVVAVLGAIALGWIAVSRLVAARPWASSGTAEAWGLGGVGVLALASVGVPVACGGIPLAGTAVTGTHALLAVAMPCAWLVAFGLRRSAPLAWAVYGTSGYTVAALLAFLAPGWPAPRYAVALTLLALAWSQAEPLPERFLGLPRDAVVVLSRALLAAIPAAGVFASVAMGGPVRSWEVVALLAAAALAWLLEGIRRGSPGYSVAAGFAVAAAADAAATALAVSAAPVAAAAVALAIGSSVAVIRASRRAGAAPAAVAAAVAAMTLPAAYGAPGDLALALLMLAAAWAAVAFAARQPDLAFVAGILAPAAGFAALERFGAPPLATVVFAACSAAALLAPTVYADRSDSQLTLTRVARALAAAGALVLVFLAWLGVASGLGDAGTAWWSVGWQGEAAALAILGGYVLVWGGLEEVEPATYAGIGLFLAAYWVVLSGNDVGQAEYFLVPAALYAAAMGYLWASRGTGREVPPVTDLVAVLLGVCAPFLLSMGSWDAAVSFRHAIWAIAIATAAIGVGLALRVRLYFLAGLAIAALDALWLSRDWLFALPKWLLIGALGLLLIGMGLGYARRQSLVGDTASRMRDALADWR